MIAAIILAAGVCAGVSLVRAGLAPRAISAGEVIAALESTRQSVEHVEAGWASRAALPLARRIGLRWVLPGTASAVAVCERRAEVHAADKAALAVLFAAMPLASAAAFDAAGVAPPTVLVVAAAVAGVVGGWFAPDVGVRNDAMKRRAELRYTLASFCDLVRLGMAGGAGLEEAVRSAADVGTGWAATQLRQALVAATATNDSPWSALAAYGKAAEVSELVELGHAMALAGTEGARIRGTLAARAASLRAHQQAAAEADAQAATERMSLPVVLLFAAFMVLVGYPAVANVLAGL